MKRVLLLFLLSLFISKSFGQSFGEIQKIESVGKTLVPNGFMPLINTSFDVSGNYVFTYNQLIPRNGRTSFWEQVNEFTLDVSEVAFVNWNAGGTNSISGMYGMNTVRTYRNKGFRWDNQFRFRYGINQQEGQELIKTEDDLELISSFGYEVSKNSNWFYSGKFSYKTQVSRGFNYPDTEVSISEFMAPGYIFLGIGAKYAQPDESFELYLSPITQKSTFVLNQRLANDGAFGVRSAVRDGDGNIIREGKTSRNEFGILVTNEFEQKIFESAVVVNRISLYSDYINNFGNIDIDWELVFNFKINNFMRASIGAHIRYDDDIKIREEAPDGTVVVGGSRIQLKQQLGIGIALQL
ncbi:hypothetical protein P700755_002897 [Psychroflexus torquis ATCC 700755]|uniref:DUF3078 domain-containing protein n=1 Tax=Psychroflexus torquis (strain ATCC 700755 / CIP 106069 / ACAM 623) TaxID=313595 RepID=K4IVW8_PSYTT|nr:DUF3078 domain-containing protein [Psychroflexus torquis]AFU69600.1 hypothetical protein P700755_002897 [Psychroflexus torquis ATCC 700755]